MLHHEMMEEVAAPPAMPAQARASGKLIVLLVLALGLAAFFYFDVGRALSLGALKENRDRLLAFTGANYATAVGLFIVSYATVTGLSLPGAVILVPICTKREKLLDVDDKKARLVVTISNDSSCTPSSYLLDAIASRGRTTFFLREGQRPATIVLTNDLLPTAAPGHPACRVSAAPLRVRSAIHYLEEGIPSSSFQVVRPFT